MNARTLYGEGRKTCAHEAAEKREREATNRRARRVRQLARFVEQVPSSVERIQLPPAPQPVIEDDPEEDELPF